MNVYASLKTCALTIAVVLAAGSCATTSSVNGAGFTPPITDAAGNTVPGSIASLETVDLNGVEQWILIRGRDVSKPLLLFLHGGPGATNMVWRELFVTRELEENFIVVLWDQRGAGKSYSPELREDEMRVDDFIEDTVALTRYLRGRFGKEKIFLLGHSWGSALGFLTMMRHPEYGEMYHAYIAAAEAANWNRRQTMSFAWTLGQARKNKQKKAIRALEELQPFDPTNRNHIEVKNRWLGQMGGEYHDAKLIQKYMAHLNKALGPEYTKADARKWTEGIEWSETTVSPQILEAGYDLFEDLPKIDIPVYFFVGRYDYQTPGPLTAEYYEAVKAPAKELIWFEQSAHYMIFAEPDKMTRELIRISRSLHEGS
jgi:pimeloyl-ACP methyl ester carboxylesterase